MSERPEGALGASAAPLPAASAGALPPRRRHRGWLLVGAVVGTLLLLLTLVGAGVLGEVQDLMHRGMEVRIGGRPLMPPDWDGGDLLLAGFAIALALVALLVLLPVLVAVVLLGIAIGVAVGIGAPLAMVLLVLAILASPLVALGVLLWWLVRRRRPPPAAL